MRERPRVSGHYSAQYEQFAADVHSRVRSAAFGEDIGQNSWLTADELEGFADWLQLDSSSFLLDVACGSGGPALHLVRQTGCTMTGVELYAEAVASGNQQARDAGLESRATFAQADASDPLPLESGSFDAILCIDAINHLRDRPQVFADWARLLRPRGRLLFTDPLVVTGMLSSDEIAIRTSIGYGLFVPIGENERLLAAAGLDVVTVEDTTEHMAVVARKRHDARAEHESALRKTEGDDTYEGRQRFFDLAARLAGKRQLSRYVYVAAVSDRP
jgi:cyclopropane fatty-acyl-phospholipid synthase-like methyltransferase